MNSRERFLAACACEPVDKTPIWLMRQAGRYLPEYRALKERHCFVTMVRTPELATEVTLQPLQRFDLDAAILFSDILVIPEALGQPYSFRDEGGINMAFAMNNEATIHALEPQFITEKLSYVADALRLIRKEVGTQKALLGFGGSPWTLAAYMVQGRSAEGFPQLKKFVWQEPILFEMLMEQLTEALIAYFKMKIEAGVDAIQIFDTWGSLCEQENYWEHSLKWIHKIIQALPEGFPVIVFAKGVNERIESLLKTGASVLSLDATVSLRAVREAFPAPFALQGNLEPSLMNTTPGEVCAAANSILDEMAPYPGHIFNLGHGILPQAKIENVEALVDCVHNFSVDRERVLV